MDNKKAANAMRIRYKALISDLIASDPSLENELTNNTI